MTAQHIGIKHT